MDDRNEVDNDLNFHTSSEQHEVRIRNAIMLDGHASELPPNELGRAWTSVFVEDPTMMSAYDARIRNNLHHEIEYRPCKVTYPNG